jgi:Flp pilus assembly protein TadG
LQAVKPYRIRRRRSNRRPGFVARRLAGAAREGGYIAVITVILAPLLFGVSAFTVDVGNWYFTVQKIQRAADAASLAGVTYMPGNLSMAKQTALAVAADNGYTTNVDPEPVDGQPSKLRVTITETVDNTFGQILGVDHTTITRSSVANYQAPLPMGSPCNGFGNGPEPVIDAVNPRSSNCSAAGQYWANVGSPAANKVSGDAYQNNVCSSSVDGCPGGTNTDYSSNGYFYSVTLSQPVTNLTIQAFDPAFVSVGDLCSSNFGTAGSATEAVKAKNHYNFNVKTSTSPESPREDSSLYASGQTSPYCTGDMLFGSPPPDTTYTIRQPVQTSNPWDPTSYPVVASCTKNYKGFSGDLYTALNQYKQNASGAVQYTGGLPQPATGYNETVAAEFRQWNTLCTFTGTVSAGTYFIQVQGNAPDDNPAGNGHNRFALRAFGANPSENAAIAISGYTNMAIYANLTSATTSFYLTKVSPAAAGQVLNVRLFDIGDSTSPGTVTIKPPADSNLSAFSGCTGSGPTTGALSDCSITANSSYNGKWQQISIPIPKGYTCNGDSVTGCWITLSYNYGGGQPSDTTSWTANLEGTPVRITE